MDHNCYKTKDLLIIVKRRKLQWYGHVSRSSGLTKTILQGTVKGRRRQGRQKNRWEDSIRKWTGLEFAKSHEAMDNREEMEESGCKIIYGAKTSLAVTGLMMMLMMMTIRPKIKPPRPPPLAATPSRPQKKILFFFFLVHHWHLLLSYHLVTEHSTVPHSKQSCCSLDKALPGGRRHASLPWKQGSSHFKSRESDNRSESFSLARRSKIPQVSPLFAFLPF